MKTGFLIIFLPILLFSAEKQPLPSVCGISLGMEKKTLVALLSVGQFTGGELTVDTNMVLLSMKKGSLTCSGQPVVAIKCLFNRTKTVQGINFSFPASTSDDVGERFNFVSGILGKPTSASSEKPGFLLEAEWKTKTFGATFFSSDADFESFLLMGLPGFLTEEMDRGKKEGIR